jgi:hypothetical protein
MAIDSEKGSDEAQLETVPNKSKLESPTGVETQDDPDDFEFTIGKFLAIFVSAQLLDIC